MSKRILCAILLGAHVSAATAQIMECIDGGGAKTYASKCPGGTVKQRQMNIRAAPPANAPAQRTIAEEEAEYRQRQADREKAEAEARDLQAKKEAIASQCAAARGRLAQLDSGRRLRYTETREVMTDEQREMETTKQRALIQKYCVN